MPAKLFHASDGFDSVDLLSYARGHLHAAEILFRTDFHCFDSAGYLAHLSIELLIKAATLHSTGSFAKEHDLTRLLENAHAAGAPLSISAEQEGVLFLLNRFQEGRYPTPESPVQIGNEDLPPIQLLWDSLLEQLPAELREPFLKRNPTLKGGRILMIKTSSEESPST